MVFTLPPTAAVIVARGDAAGQLQPVGLRCEYLTDPLGVGETAPRLSWTGESPRRGESQRAYQVLVASTPEALARDEADRWDSARVESDESAHVAYAGRPLVSRDACFWKVRLWDRDGNVSAWSAPARWTIGLLEPADWQAKWIDGHDPHAPEPVSSVKLRRAVYETPDGRQTADVTAALDAVLRSGRHDVHVNPRTLEADPAPGKHKRLQFDYEEAGVPVSAYLQEDEIITVGVASATPRALRKTFAVDGAVTRATLYVTALGFYECRLNGQRVGDHVLAPEWTDYDHRVRYQAYDVSDLVRTGDNALGATLAAGWYAGHIGAYRFEHYGKVPALLAQLEIVHADGRTERVVTDATWKSHGSAILASDMFRGESHDARLEAAGWDAPGFDDADWVPAYVREDEKPRALDWQVAPPVRVLGECRTVALTEPAPGRWTFDVGQNMVGVARIRVSAPAGTVLMLRHAEMLNPDGTIYTDNLRTATSLDTFVCRGGGPEEWQPAFTFHGFRYVELTGLPARPAADAVTGVVIGSDVGRAGTFACSDARLNQLMSNVEWGLRGNHVSIPTDCPQRDERLGWLGDAQVFVRTATNLADMAAFYTKWLVDVDDAQTPEGVFPHVAPDVGIGGASAAWADAGVICPWTIYQAYGDRRILERHLPAMTRWVEWMRRHSPGLLRDHSGFGDWLSIDADTPKDVIGTAYFAYSTHLLARSYRAVGRDDEAAKYQALFEDVRGAFNRAYVAPDGRIKGDTQCVYAMALKFELLPGELRSRAVQFLVDDVAAHQGHLTTGFVGVSYLLPVLSAGGRLDTAYALLRKDTFPSWLFSVKQGATTIWERWDGWTPEKGFQTTTMNSFNHYSLGSCGEWMYDTMAGIGWDEDAPGYRRMVIHPRPGGGVSFVRATRQTMYGQVECAWRREGGRFTLDVTVPANTTARVVLPAAEASGVTEGGQAVADVGEIALAAPTDGDVTLAVGSGTYHFACEVGEKDAH